MNAANQDSLASVIESLSLPIQQTAVKVPNSHSNPSPAEKWSKFQALAYKFVADIAQYARSKNVRKSLASNHQPELSAIYTDLVQYLLTFVISTVRGFGMRSVISDAYDNKTLNVFITDQIRIAQKLIDNIANFELKVSNDSDMQAFLKALKTKLHNVQGIQDVQTKEDMIQFIDNNFGPAGIETKRREQEAFRILEATKAEQEKEYRAKLRAEEDKLRNQCNANIEKIQKLYQSQLDIITETSYLKNDLEQLIENDQSARKLDKDVKAECNTFLQTIDKDVFDMQSFASQQKLDTTTVGAELAQKCQEVETNITKLSEYADKIVDVFIKLGSYREDLRGAVRIFVRVKPLNGGSVNKQDIVYDDDNVNANVHANVTKLSKTSKQKEGLRYLTFHRRRFGPFFNIFRSTFNNRQIFENIKTLVNQIESGYHIALFGYGYSGSGKTYTLVNNNANDYGITLHAINHLIAKGYAANVITIQELYIDDISGFNSGIKFAGKRIIDHTTVSIRTSDDFIKLFDKLDKSRRAAKRIRATVNNPDSSRSHLFITLNIGSGYLTICDMGGRENPIEIYNTTKITPEGDLVSITNDCVYTLEGVKKGYEAYNNRGEKTFICHKPSEYKTITDITGFKFGTFFTSSKFNKDQYTGNMKEYKDNVNVKKAIKYVFETCKEGFYINETINHLSWYFNVLNNRDMSPQPALPNVILDESFYNVDHCFVPPEKIISISEQTVKSDVIPSGSLLKMLSIKDGHAEHTGDKEVYRSRATTQVRGPVHMINVLNELRNLKGGSGNKPTKFAMFACIRQEPDQQFVSFGTQTLNFAENIASTAVHKQ